MLVPKHLRLISAMSIPLDVANLSVRLTFVHALRGVLRPVVGVLELLFLPVIRFPTPLRLASMEEIVLKVPMSLNLKLPPGALGQALPANGAEAASKTLLTLLIARSELIRWSSVVIVEIRGLVTEALP